MIRRFIRFAGGLSHELDDELKFHLFMRARDNQAAGMDSEDARADAARRFGNETAVKERTREMDLMGWLETAGKDLRYAARMLWKSPGFTIIAVLALALGIGANTAIFSFVNAVLLRSLPYPEADRLVLVREYRERERSAKGDRFAPVSGPDFLDWRGQAKSFEAMAALDFTSYNLSKSGEPERLLSLRVAPAFFRVLGVTPALGRDYAMEEEQPGRDRVVVMTHRLWQRRFNRDPRIVGSTIHLNEEPYQVIGVLPESFRFPMAAGSELFVPLTLDRTMTAERAAHWLQVIARLKHGVTIGQAHSEMAVIAAQLEKEHRVNRGHSAAVQALQEEVSGKVKPALLILLGAVGLVLLIACSNVANLLLARASARAREVLVRRALGCSRGRLIRQFLTESMVLGVIGGAAGLALATWALSALQAAFAKDIDAFTLLGGDRVAFDPMVLGATLALSVLTGIAFGIVPALEISRSDLGVALRQSGGRGSTAAGMRTRAILVIAETALAVVLTIGAGLLVKSFVTLRQVDTGFRQEGLLTMELMLAPTKYRDGAQVTAFYQQLVERARAIPGVRSAGAVDLLPMSGQEGRTSIRVEGRAPRAEREILRVHPRAATVDYLSAMGVPFRKGRAFTEADAAGRPRVAIVNELTAARYFDGADPIGKRIQYGGSAEWIEVVGVTASIRHNSPEREANPELFVPFLQSPSRYMTIVVRVSVEPSQVAAELRKCVAQLDADQPVTQIRRMDDLVSSAVAPQRFNTLLLGGFAGLALLLAMAGIYGVISYSVTQRTNEIGIRMALGASARSVLWMSLRHGMAWAMVGIAIGIGGAFAGGRVLSDILFQVKPVDAQIFILAPIVFAVVAALACYVPARRATRVDPMIALRWE